MAHHIFIVNVRTDDNHVDAPPAEALRNEILNNLEYDARRLGIERVTVRESRPFVPFPDPEVA